NGSAQLIVSHVRKIGKAKPCNFSQNASGSNTYSNFPGARSFTAMTLSRPQNCESGSGCPFTLSLLKKNSCTLLSAQGTCIVCCNGAISPNERPSLGEKPNFGAWM